MKSFYIKPKFKIGQKISAIKQDKIHEIQIEKIVYDLTYGIKYFAKNRLYDDSQCFATETEAKDFMDSAYRIPFGKGDLVWEGSLIGVRETRVQDGDFWFESNMRKHDNSRLHTDGSINSTSCFENQIEATEKSLSFIKFFESNKNKQ